ncbi:DUF421 domain-containing protein [Peribacillus saganii]|uniref:DUF421 domain-containing protein n=1 Tax=Peribacillus saganii TaxID=2303992 RepID=A0A372LTV1_9BACI|nr:DUF421 domain-containing protein [Peribacillus saganii]RFU71608.1 DUF421 domain-containing protein [Peribacillus saganii]
MEEYFMMVLRTIFMYFIILLIFRLMGKREIGEVSILDLVVFVMIAEMAVVAIEDRSRNISEALLPMFVLLVIQVGMAMLSIKSQKFREMVDGKPSLIINHGKIDEKVMKQQRYNFDDLLVQLREKGIIHLSDVEFAILEPSGKLSVIKKDEGEKNIALPLILDGKLQTQNLAGLGRDITWLKAELKKRGFDDFDSISFCSMENGRLFIDAID